MSESEGAAGIDVTASWFTGHSALRGAVAVLQQALSMEVGAGASTGDTRSTPPALCDVWDIAEEESRSGGGGV